ncbi:electron transporter RnfD, partial [bacterium]
MYISSSPHIRKDWNVKKIMYGVVIALMPAFIGSIYFFGWRAAYLTFLSVVTAVLTEYLFQKITKRKITAFDGSAIITGILLAFNIPVKSPWWLPVVGSFFAILVAKQFFGGLGYNIFNPALAGRAFVMASWPQIMTGRWSAPLHGSISGIDGITSATPLNLLKLHATDPAVLSRINSPEMLKNLFIGNVGGCIGETSALLLLIGAIFLFVMRYADWRISVGYIGTVFVVAWIFYLTGLTPAGPLFHILSGGVFLGGLFMA